MTSRAALNPVCARFGMPVPVEHDPGLVALEQQLLCNALARGVQEQPLGACPDFEILLLKAIAPLLRHRNGIDIGAERGSFAQAFLDLGLQTLAIEASPMQARALRRRFLGRVGVRVLFAAMSDQDGRVDLHLARHADERPSDGYGSGAYNSLIDTPVPGAIDFPCTITVPRRRLSTLVRTGIAPPNIGVLKVDTEGHDLAVLAGAWPHVGEVTILEYWAGDFVFNKGRATNDLSDYLAFLSDKPERLHMLVIARDENQHEIMFQVNPRAALPNSWGNVLLFRREDLMRAAVDWCLGTLSSARYRF
jgi:FkbM family methyltransferase